MLGRSLKLQTQRDVAVKGRQLLCASDSMVVLYINICVSVAQLYCSQPPKDLIV